MTYRYRFEKKDIVAIFIIFFLGIVLRSVYLSEYQNTSVFPLVPYSDSYSYFLTAKDIAAGPGPWEHKAFMTWPLYAYFVAVLFKIFGSSLSIVYFLQFILGAVSGVLIYLITKKIFNRKAAVIAAIFFLLHGLFIFYEGLLMYTSLAIFLNSALFLALLYIKDKPNAGTLFLAGIGSGICTLAQPNIAVFGVFAVIWMSANARTGLRKALFGISCFILALGMVVGAVTVRNYLAEKDFVPISGNTGFNFYMGNNPQATGSFFCPANFTLNKDEMNRDARIIAKVEMRRDLKTSEVSDFWFRKAFGYIKKDPLRYIGLYFKKLCLMFSPAEHGHEMEYLQIEGRVRIFRSLLMNLSLTLPLGILGMILGVRKAEDTTLLYIILITMSLGTSLFVVVAKLRLMIVPFLIIFASYAVFSMLDSLQKRKYAALAAMLTAAVALFVLLNHAAFPADSGASGRRSQIADYEHHLLNASEYEKADRYKDAMNELDLARRIMPQAYLPIFRMGVIFFNTKDFKMAEDMFRRSLQLNPTGVDIYYNLGLLYNNRHRYAEARDMLEKCIYLDNESAPAHFELGLAYKGMRSFGEAKKEFAVALEKINAWRLDERKVIEKELQELSWKY